MLTAHSAGVSDSDLRETLLGTWRLTNCRENVYGTLVKPYGDNPHGYLVYTPDGHVVVQFAVPERPDLFGPSADAPRVSVLRKTTEANTAIGFMGYCGTFEILDGEVVRHMEFGIQLGMSGRVEARTVVIDGDRLTLGTPRGRQFEWQRVH
jgi:hypothetical protein